MSKSKQNSPIDSLREGLETGNWQLVSQAYKGLTGVSVTPPASTPSGYEDLIEQIVARYTGTPRDPVEAVEETPVTPTKRGRKKKPQNDDGEPPEVVVSKKEIEDSKAKPLRAIPKISSDKLDFKKEMQVISIDALSSKKKQANANASQEKMARDPAEWTMECNSCGKEFPKRMCLQKTGFESDGKSVQEYKCPHCSEINKG
jgi:hypothetical protein